MSRKLPMKHDDSERTAGHGGRESMRLTIIDDDPAVARTVSSVAESIGFETQNYSWTLRRRMTEFRLLELQTLDPILRGFSRGAGPPNPGRSPAKIHSATLR
jgi:hypothetical protein